MTAQPLVLARDAATRVAIASGATAVQVVLTTLVLGVFVWRLLTALARPTPTYMPDEFLYSELARSLATEGRPQLRGEPISFPALLDPVLTAPVWLAGNVEIAFRATQAIHALAFALAAVPAYLLCRALALDRRVSLAAAAFTLVQPAAIFAGWVTADALGLTLALFALWAAVRALGRPTRSAQVLAFVLTAAATFARLQYIALFAVVPLGAALLDGSRPREALRRWWPTVALLAFAAVGAIAVGPDRVLGIYRGVGALGYEPGELVPALSTQATGLGYAWSAALLPGAAVGLAVVLVRPRDRVERAFSLVTLTACAALLAEATLLAAGVGGERFMERYLIVLAPLLVPAFVLSLGRGRVAALTTVAGAGALVAFTAREPISGLTAGDLPSDSPTLRAVLELHAHLGTATAAAIASGAVAVLAAAGAAAALHPRLRGLALGAAVCGALACTVLASSLDRTASNRAAGGLPPATSWIDDAGLEEVALLATPGTTSNFAYQQLFWNRSLRTILRMPGVPPLDQGSSLRVSIADDGSILAGGRPVARALAVSTVGSTVRLRGVSPLTVTPTASLVRVTGDARVELLADRTYDGWLAVHGYVRVWQPSARVRGTLVLSLRGVRDSGVATVSLTAPGYRRTVRLDGSETVAVRVPAEATGAWQLEYRARRGTYADGRATSVRAPEPPRFIPSAG